MQAPTADTHTGTLAQAYPYTAPLTLPQTALPDLVAHCIQRDQPEEALHWFMAFQEAQGQPIDNSIGNNQGIGVSRGSIMSPIGTQTHTHEGSIAGTERGIGSLSREVSETVCSLLVPALAGVGGGNMPSPPSPSRASLGRQGANPPPQNRQNRQGRESWDGLFYVLSEMRLHGIPLRARDYALLIRECEHAPVQRWTHARRWVDELYNVHYLNKGDNTGGCMGVCVCMYVSISL